MRRVFKLGAIGVGLSAVLAAIQGCTMKDVGLFFLTLFALSLASGNSGQTIPLTETAGPPDAICSAQFNGQTVYFAEVNGSVVIGGDIVLGSFSYLIAKAQAAGYQVACRKTGSEETYTPQFVGDPATPQGYRILDQYMSYVDQELWYLPSLWTDSSQGGRVPYVIAGDWGGSTSDMTKSIESAMADWHAKVPTIKFEPKNSSDHQYVKFEEGDWNSAGLGKRDLLDPDYKGVTIVKLVCKSKWTWSYGTVTECADIPDILHEIGHALGVLHEHQRPDGEVGGYIKLHYENLDKDQCKKAGYDKSADNLILDECWAVNFKPVQKPPSQVEGTYDYDSIMHYPVDGFAKPGTQTIEILKQLPAEVKVGQRDHLSAGDIATAQRMYPGVGVAVSPQAPDDLRLNVLISPYPYHIQLSWSDKSNNESGFRIYRDNRQLITVAPGVRTGVRTYTDSGLSDSTQYCYKVSAYNSGGESATTSQACATTQAAPVQPPAKPSGLTATAVSSSAIALTWSYNNTNHTGFKIYRTDGLQATAGAAERSYTDPGLKASTQYCYRVSAYNSAGESAKTSQACATTKAPPVQPPTSVTLTLYVREGSETGQVISGVLIAGHVEGGDTFSQSTNPSGFVTITAQPGKWYFSAYKPPYETKNWTWDITQTDERVVVLNASTPVLQVSPSSLNFSTVQNQNPPPQTIAISNAGTGTLNWTASSNKSWLSVVPTSGTGNAQVTVSINASGLGAGTHTGSITVSAPGASPSSVVVLVSLSVAAPSEPILQVSTTAMSFTAQQGQIPATQSFNISNANGGTLSWSVVDDRNWISINPSSGTNAGVVTVSINPSGLGVGIYTGAITVSALGASPSTATINITLTITAASEMAILQVSPAELHFSAQAGRIPATQSFWIRNVGQGGMVWSLTVIGDWILPDRFMGSIVDGLVSVNADAIGKEPGQYTGSITVTAHGCTDCPTMVDAMGSPQTIPVTLEILPNQSQVYSVQVDVIGMGNGSFSFAPPGIFCGVNCRTYDAGTQATITALPDAGSVFASWSPGGCDIVIGNQCTVTMNGHRTTSATFNLVSTGGDLVWTLRQPLPEDKANSAVAVYNNEIYVIGGELRITNYKYNPTSNSWTRLPDSPGNGVDMGGAAVINGLIYAVDALFDKNLKIFNPATQSWSVGPVLPSPELRQAASVAAVNGKLYVIGGTDTSFNGISVVSEYNPVNGTWTDKAPMPTPRGYAATAVLNGEIYVIGGLDNNAPPGVNPDYVVEAYNPTTDQWTVKLSPPVAAGHSLPSGQGRWGAVAGAIGGRIYLTGGMRYVIGGTELLSTTLEYDPILNQWAQRNSMNVARFMAVGAVVFDSFYVIGGEGGFRTVEQGVLTTNP